MALLDQHGRPLRPRRARRAGPGAHQRWRDDTDLDYAYGGYETAEPSLLDMERRWGWDRELLQERIRRAYHYNPLVSGAIRLLEGYILGSRISSGQLVDKSAAGAWEDFWRLNNLSRLTDRFFREIMQDGEALAVWPESPPAATAARIGLVDISRGLRLETAPGDPRRLVKAWQGGRSWDEGQFVYAGFEAGDFNDPRGWPPLATALDPARAYLHWLEDRIAVNRIMARLNAVHYAFDDATLEIDETGEEIEDKGTKFGKIPRTGALVTLAMDRMTGHREELQFLQGARQAMDAAEDGRAILRVFAIATGITLPLLSEATTSNLASARVQMQGMIAGLQRWQDLVRDWHSGLLRLELLRRFGAEREYRAGATGELRVSAQELSAPTVLPRISTRSVEELVRRVETGLGEGLMSRRTAAAELDLDYEQERHFMKEEGEMKEESEGQ